MGDIKLFDLTGGTVRELQGSPVAVEKSLQTLIETHLETFLGIRFVASEYITGKTHGGRIDTLGLDENGFPVIIEYKRALNENVINQGLFYLDWLLDHKAEFEKVVAGRLGGDAAAGIDWSSPRLLCIAGDFTRYDEHAVLQIGRNIELIRYRRYGATHLLLELVNAITTLSTRQVTAQPSPTVNSSGNNAARKKTVSDYLEQSPDTLKDLYQQLRDFAMSLGDEVQLREKQEYHAYRRLRNFLCVIVHPRDHRLVLMLKVNPDTVELEDGFTKDVRGTGEYSGDLEVRIYDAAGLERAKPLILKSYEIS
ncbi:MAG: DUF91 domain-containing protein [Chloroflexi bacterium]|nr:DUF91 domain-containing protein [Chloroflexota bacterium]